MRASVRPLSSGGVPVGVRQLRGLGTPELTWAALLAPRCTAFAEPSGADARLPARGLCAALHERAGRRELGTASVVPCNWYRPRRKRYDEHSRQGLDSNLARRLSPPLAPCTAPTGSGTTSTAPRAWTSTLWTAPNSSPRSSVRSALAGRRAAAGAAAPGHVERPPGRRDKPCQASASCSLPLPASPPPPPAGSDRFEHPVGELALALAWSSHAPSLPPLPLPQAPTALSTWWASWRWRRRPAPAATCRRRSSSACRWVARAAGRGKGAVAWPRAHREARPARHRCAHVRRALPAPTPGSLTAASGPSPRLLTPRQHEREAQLAVLLGALLRRYVEGDAEGFRVSGRLPSSKPALALPASRAGRRLAGSPAAGSI